MGPKPKDVTDAELAILHVLWDQGTATIRQLTDVLYPGSSPSHYSTVKKLLARLEAKGCVRRDRRAAVHVFKAAIEQQELIDRRLQALADGLCGGSRTPLLMHLLQTKRLTARERRELYAFLDELIQLKSKRAR